MRVGGLSAPRAVLGLLCLLYLVLFVVRVAISGVAPLIKADLRLSNTELGWVFSAFAIPYAIFQLIGGWIGDRWGARMVLCVSCGVVAAATALTGPSGTCRRSGSRRSVCGARCARPSTARAA